MHYYYFWILLHRLRARIPTTQSRLPSSSGGICERHFIEVMNLLVLHLGTSISPAGMAVFLIGGPLGGITAICLNSKVCAQARDRKVGKPNESPALPESSIFLQRRAFLRPEWR